MSRAQQYPRLILALVCLPVFIGALDLTIVSAVLPEVIRSMTIEIQKLDVAGWVVTGYFVSYAISMTFMGRVSDISGRRVVYLVCLAIFFVFLPSFIFVIAGAHYVEQVRDNRYLQAFLAGVSAAVVGVALVVEGEKFHVSSG